MTKKEQLTRRYTELEGIVERSRKEMEAITNELTNTPDALLERDEKAELTQFFKDMNEHLREQGLLP